MITPGLARISRLLRPVPTPWHAIHVAGTNGKGSVCAYVAAMLDLYNRSAWRRKTGHAPLRVGRFTSPHLVDRWDGIRDHTGVISEARFTALEQRVLERNEREGIGASEFEILTATAFEHSTESEIDIGIVEVGMGGRDDATNILGQAVKGAPSTYRLDNGRTLRFNRNMPFRQTPLVAAITAIGLDHQGFLGDTLEEIAAHKAGIIKPDTYLVYDRSNLPEVKKIFNTTAVARGTALIVDWKNIMPGQPSHVKSLAAWLDLPATFQILKLPFQRQAQFAQMLPHVRMNTSVALRSAYSALLRLDRVPLHFLHKNSPPREPKLAALVQAMTEVPLMCPIPGRQGVVDVAPLTGGERLPVLVDGAHNPASADALAAMLEKRGQRDGRAFIVAVSAGRDPRPILAPLLKAKDSVFAVEFETPVAGMPWVASTPSTELAKAIGSMPVAEQLQTVQDCGADVRGALTTATALPQPKAVVVCGSLYLAGQVHRMLRAARAEAGLPPEETEGLLSGLPEEWKETKRANEEKTKQSAPGRKQQPAPQKRAQMGRKTSRPGGERQWNSNPNKTSPGRLDQSHVRTWKTGPDFSSKENQTIRHWRPDQNGDSGCG